MTSAVDDVKERLSIEDVVGQYVQLKRSGRNFKGLSPFSSEKTPSFVVSPEKQIWHDFSSGRGGNMFSFVMEMEGLDFKAALELLARQAGVDLSRYQSAGYSTRTADKEKLYQLLEMATKFYQTHLIKSRAAQKYLIETRHLSKQSLLDFQIGYAPNSGTALADFLTKKGFSIAQLRAAGVATSRGSRLNDMFRERIMIPLASSTGQIIGFTSRVLNDQSSGPKYLNTPQTLLYDKSRHVFGLHLAKEAIRQHKYAVIVEGNLDVIASHQAGIKQVVATAGTALTDSQLKTLAYLTTDIRLAFDEDSAGIKASERAIPIASRAGVGLQIVTLPSGKDPDDLIAQGIDLWQKTIETPVYAVDWLMEQYARQLDITTGQGKRQYSDIILDVVGKISDQVEKEHYLEKLATGIGVSRGALQAKLSQTPADQGKKIKQPKKETVEAPQETVERTKLQDHFLAIMLMHPELRKLVTPIIPDMLISQSAMSFLTFLRDNPDFELSDKLATPLQSIAEYIKILVLQYEELYGDLQSLELHYEASRLQAQLIQHYVKRQKLILGTRLIEADELTTSTLLEEAKQLDKLLKTNKGATHD